MKTTILLLALSASVANAARAIPLWFEIKSHHIRFMWTEQGGHKYWLRSGSDPRAGHYITVVTTHQTQWDMTFVSNWYPMTNAHQFYRVIEE